MGRRDITPIFGTSMIDLLVGAMSMMALLWVFNVQNNGRKGFGDVEFPSYYVSVNAYGFEHIGRRFQISDNESLSCEFQGSEDNNKFESEPICSFSSNIQLDSNRVEFLSEVSADSYVAVNWDSLDGFKSGFTLDISKQQKDEVEITLDIGPCRASEPHYIHISGYSDGEIIDHLIIHQTSANYLNEERGKKFVSREGVYEKDDDGNKFIQDKDKWIIPFVDQLKVSRRIPEIYIFTFINRTNEAETQAFETPVKLKFSSDGSFEYDISGFIRSNDQKDIDALKEYIENF